MFSSAYQRLFIFDYGIARVVVGQKHPCQILLRGADLWIVYPKNFLKNANALFLESDALGYGVLLRVGVGQRLPELIPEVSEVRQTHRHMRMFFSKCFLPNWKNSLEASQCVRIVVHLQINRTQVLNRVCNQGMFLAECVQPDFQAEPE